MHPHCVSILLWIQKLSMVLHHALTTNRYMQKMWRWESTVVTWKIVKMSPWALLTKKNSCSSCWSEYAATSPLPSCSESPLALQTQEVWFGDHLDPAFATTKIRDIATYEDKHKTLHDSKSTWALLLENSTLIDNFQYLTFDYGDNYHTADKFCMVQIFVVHKKIETNMTTLYHMIFPDQCTAVRVILFWNFSREFWTNENLSLYGTR